MINLNFYFYYFINKFEIIFYARLRFFQQLICNFIEGIQHKILDIRIVDYIWGIISQVIPPQKTKSSDRA